MTAQLEAKPADREQNHYWRYHRLFDLLTCKQPLTNSMDEDLFISVHQVCELSFHQMILDLDRTLTALSGLKCDIGAAEEASYFLDRVVALYGTVNRTVPVLADMRGFVEFRQALGPSSGFQSFQFRRIEIMSGITEPYWRGGTSDADGRPHPAEAAFDRSFGAVVEGWFRTYRHHSLRHYYEDLLARVPGASRAARLTVLRELPDMRRLLELLKAYDEAQSQFHRVHMAVAMRQLARVGVSVGTGGTSYKRYLDKYLNEHAPLFDGLQAREAAKEKAA
jgi:tryptophan 2,3-dioxygenase